VSEVIGLIGPLEGKGNGRVMRRYALVFTPNELVCIKIGGTLGMLFATIVGEAISETYGLSTISDVYNHLGSKRADSLKEMQVQDIVEVDKLNFCIPYGEVTCIEMKKGGIFSPRGRMRINLETTRKKYWFRIVEQQAFNNYVSLIRKILPNKIAN
jgi:hypothetical protein